MSNVVDTKVVELQFENKDFEKNATQSISTLEKLKDSLDFTGSTKGLEDINSNIKAVNFDNLTNGIKETTKGFSVMETIAFGVFNEIGKKIADLGIGVAKSFGNLITFVPRQIWSGGSQRAHNVEQARFMLQGLEIDLEAINKELKISERYFSEAEKAGGEAIKSLKGDIDFAVSGTAFGFDQAAKAAAQLSASGIQIGEDMRAALKGISGVASMTNTSYDEISRIFTKVAGANRLYATELNSIAARGLNASKAITDYMNGVSDGTIDATESVKKAINEMTGGLAVAEEDIRSFTREGSLNFEIFSKAMFEAYADQSSKANDTYSGALTNVKAQLSRIGQLFAEPIFEDARRILVSLYNLIKSVQSKIADSAFLKAFIDLSDKVTTAVTSIIDAITALVNGTDFDIVGHLKKLFGFGEVEEAAEEASDRISGSFEEIRDTAFKVIKGDFGNGMDRINKLTEEGFDAEAIQSYVNALWEVSGHDWSKIFDEDIQQQAAALVDLSTGSEEAGKSIDFLNKQLEENDTGFENLGKKDKVMFGLINIFTGLSAAFASLKKTFQEKIKLPTLDGVLDTLSTKFLEFSQAFNDFTTKHADDIAAVFGGIAAAVMILVGVFKTLVSVALTVLGVVFLPFIAVIGGIVVAISKAATAVHNWAVENQILQKITDKVSKTVEDVKAKIKGWWESFLALPGVSKTLGKFKDAFTTAFEKAPQYLSKTKKAVGTFVKRAATAFKLLRNGQISPELFFKNIKAAWDDFVKTIGNFEFIKKIKEAFGTAKDTFKQWFHDLGDNADGTRNTFGKFTDTVGAGFDWIKEKAVGAWTKVSDYFQKHQLGDFFSRNFERVKGAFSRFFTNLPTFFSGLKDKWSEFMQKVTDMGGFKIENAGQIWDAFKETIGQYWKDQDIFAPIKEAFSQVKEDAKAKLKEMGIDVDKIIEDLKSIPDKIKAYFTDENGNVSITAGINRLFTDIKTAFETGTGEVDTVVNGEGGILETLRAIPGKIIGFFTDKETGAVGIGPAINNLFSAIVTAFNDGTDEVSSNINAAGGILDTIGSIPGKIIAFFTDDKTGKLSITAAIGHMFDAIVGAFGDGKQAIDDAVNGGGEGGEGSEGGGGILGAITSLPEKIKTFFDGWELPEGFNIFTSIGEAFKDLCTKIKEGFESVDWDKVELIMATLGAIIVPASVAMTFSSIKGIVDTLVDTFGKKGKARALTGFSLLEISIAIGIVSGIIVKLCNLTPKEADALPEAYFTILLVSAVLGGLQYIGNTYGGGKLAALNGLGNLLTSIGIGVVVKCIEDLSNSEITWGAIGTVLAIAAALEAMQGISLAIGKGEGGPKAIFAPLAGLGNLVTAIGIKEVADALVEINEAEVSWKTVGQLGAIAVGLEALTVINGFLGPLRAVAAFLGGSSFLTMAAGIYAIVESLRNMKGMDKDTTKKRAGNIVSAYTTLADGLDKLTITDKAKQNVKDLQEVIKSVSSFGTKTAWGNLLAGLPQFGVNDLLHPLTSKTKTSAEVATETATTVGGIIEAWNTGLNGATLDLDQLDGVQRLIGVLSSAVWTGFNELTGGELSGFETNAENLAKGVNAFTTTLEDFDPEIASKATGLIQDLTTFAQSLRMLNMGQYTQETDGTFYGAEAGDIASFGGQIGMLAQKVKEYVDKVSEFTGFAEAAENTKNLADGAEILASLNLSDGDIFEDGKVSSFTTHLNTIVEAMRTAAMEAFSTSAGIDKMKENVETIANTSLGESSASEDTKSSADEAAKSIENSKSSFSDAMGTAIGGAVEAIRNAATDFKTAGFGLTMQVSLGIRAGKDNIDLAAKAAVGDAASSVRKKYSDFYSSGNYLGQGFANGMKGQYSNVWNKANELASAAITSIKERIKQGSPSKVTYESGKFTGMGFVNGIAEYIDRAYSTGDRLADAARRGVANAVDKINRVVSNELDAEPTIRPVLDLSEIQNGANSIGSILNTSPSLALAGNLGAIDAAITSRTDPNAAIVSALDSLKSELNRPNVTNNNINGITYDDGSNLVSAVETLVRAANVERRV